MNMGVPLEFVCECLEFVVSSSTVTGCEPDMLSMIQARPC